MPSPSEESIFAKALGLSAHERTEYLERVCGDNKKQQERIESLLNAHQNPDSFLVDGSFDETQNLANQHSLVGKHIGPYKLLQEIGEGGMGLVYLAERQHPVKQRVALKIVKLGLDSKTFIARFEAERQALALMDHPNIARVLDAGCTETGRPYFVMELVKGIPITRFCDENKLSTRERLELFKQVCQAIHHAHQKGIIHRDVKPSNVLVALYDDKPVPKVIDFGVAKATNQRLTDKTLFTEIGSILGTWEYMSPEQAVLNQLDVDTRTDVYSLGVLLYELLTGVTPIDRKRLRTQALEETLRLIREEEPQRPSTRISALGKASTATATFRRTKPDSLVAEVRGDLDWIVMKSLEKERSKRYESAMEFARDVQRFADDQPVLAGPPTFRYRFKKFLSRNKIASSIGGVVLALTALGLVLALVGISNYQIKQKVTNQNLAITIESAAIGLGRAENSPIGVQKDWIAAEAGSQRVSDLLKNSNPSRLARLQGELFLNQFSAAHAKRRLAEELENVVITCATHDDVQSWNRMEKKLRTIFTDRNMDFDDHTPAEVAVKIRHHPSAVRLADALDLWIATQAQLGMMTGVLKTKEEMQPWADALYEADNDPIRTGIRKIIHRQRAPSPEFLEGLIKDVELATLEPRTLTWLAIAFIMSGDNERSNEIHRKTLLLYPHDLMVNFDFALTLGRQERWEHALRYYMRCTAIRPDVAGFWRAIGNTLRKTDELEESYEILKHAVSIQPDYAPILVDLAKTQIAQKRFDLALASTELAIVKDREISSDVYLYLGQAHMGLGNFQEAIVAFEKLIQLASQSVGTFSEDELDQVDQWLKACRENRED